METFEQRRKAQPRWKHTNFCENEACEGESIERKVEKMFAGKEHVELVRSPIYQQRRDGINPAYDIRTDRHEVMREAVAKSTEKYYEARQMRMDEAEAKANAVSNGVEPTRTTPEGGDNQ